MNTTSTPTKIGSFLEQCKANDRKKFQKVITNTAISSTTIASVLKEAGCDVSDRTVRRFRSATLNA